MPKATQALTTSRRTLLGAAPVFLLAGPSPEPAADADLLAACQRFLAVNAEMARLNADPFVIDGALDLFVVEHDERLLAVANTPARTAVGLRAKAGALIAALEMEVGSAIPYFGVEQRACPHEMIAWRLAHELLGIGQAESSRG